MIYGIAWWRWLTEPWDSAYELWCRRLAAHYLALLDRYPRLLDWPQEEALRLALELRGVHPEIAARAAAKTRAAAEHEQGHR